MLSTRLHGSNLRSLLSSCSCLGNYSATFFLAAGPIEADGRVDREVKHIEVLPLQRLVLTFKLEEDEKKKQHTSQILLLLHHFDTVKKIGVCRCSYPPVNISIDDIWEDLRT